MIRFPRPRLLLLHLGLCLALLMAGELRAAGVEVVNASIGMTLAGTAANAGISGTNSRAGDPSSVGADSKSDTLRIEMQRGEGQKADPLRTDGLGEPEAWLLNADVRFSVNARLEDLLEQGVPLYFVTEVEAFRPRWYWKDELVLKASQTVRLTYQAITRQYRVSRGPLALNYPSLSDALRAMGTVRSWRFADGKALTMKTQYDVYVRFRLDKSQLPKPFQLTMLTDSDWVPVSEWKHFSFTPERSKTAP
jgi:hypothetical protein